MKTMWREQIKTVETKVSKRIDVLYKTNYVFGVQTLHTLYLSLDEPYILEGMSYFCEIWGNMYLYRLRKLSLLQKKAIRIIYNLDYHGCTYVYLRCSKILELQDLITHKNMIVLSSKHLLFRRLRTSVSWINCSHTHAWYKKMKTMLC